MTPFISETPNMSQDTKIDTKYARNKYKIKVVSIDTRFMSKLTQEVPGMSYISDTSRRIQCIQY